MKTGKWAVMLLAIACMGLGGCDKENVEPPTSEKVTTGEATEITTESAVLAGSVNVDIKDYSSVACGMMVSDDLQEMNNRKGEKIWGSTLIGKNYTVELKELADNTRYYYRAFVFLDVTQYEFGAIKEFTTLQGSTPTAKGFSVSENKQVAFSRGNLQYTQSTKTWAFAANQYDMLGTANVSDGTESYDATYGYSKDGSALADKIDLFGWSTNNETTKWGISTSTSYSDYAGDFVDWGTNTIGTNAPNTYRTLTQDEWYYLLNTRPNASEKQGIARIQLSETDYANGLILLPDSWTCPTDVTFKSGFASDWSIEAYATYQTFTLAEWQKLEAAGAVFLPASGYRDGSSMSNVQYYGDYRSATANDSSSACSHRFNSNGAHARNGDNRTYGQAVRLVRDL